MRYAHIGWCQEDKHDKVWGIICLQEPDYSEMPTGEFVRPYGKYVTFWGRRGATLQTKILEEDTDIWELEKMFQKKLNKGYQSVSKSRLDEVYPGFEQDLEKTAVWAALRA